MPLQNDTAVRAFRKYIRMCPDTDKLPYFVFCERVRGACRTDREALRLISVHETLLLLRATGREECVEAIRYIYFSERGRTPKKNEISFRVRRFARMNSMDERTVWRRIEEAKSLLRRIVEIRENEAVSEQ